MAAKRAQYQMVPARLRDGRLRHDIVFSIHGHTMARIGDIRAGDDKRLIDFHRFGNFHFAARRNAMARRPAHRAGHVAHLNAGNGNGDEPDRLFDSRRSPPDMERNPLLPDSRLFDAIAL